MLHLTFELLLLKVIHLHYYTVPVCPGPGLSATAPGYVSAPPAVVECWPGSFWSSVPAAPLGAAWHSPALRTPLPAANGKKNSSHSFTKASVCVHSHIFEHIYSNVVIGFFKSVVLVHPCAVGHHPTHLYICL